MSNEEILNKEAAETTAPQETDEAVGSPATDADKPATESVDEKPEQAEEKSESVDEKTEPTEEKPEPKEKAPAQKVKADKPAKPSGKGMSKIFKLIYFPVVAVFVALMLIFSIIDGAFGYSPEVYGDDYYTAVNTHITEISRHPRSAMSAMSEQGIPVGVTAARDYIKDTLVAGGFKLQEESKPDVEDDEKQVTDTEWYRPAAGIDEPTVTFQTAVPSVELQNAMGVDKLLAGYELTNIVAAIPSRIETAGAIVITVRYDGRTDTVGAADNAAFVANVMQSLIEYVKSEATPKNDIVVVFTEELDSAFGSYAFFDSFTGLNNVVSRAIAGVNFDAYGNSGTLAITDADGASLDYINAVTGISGSAFNSSVAQDALPTVLVRKDAVKAFGDIPAVQIAVLGGLDSAQSSRDTAENISQAIIRQQSEVVKNYLQKFAGATGEYGAENDGIVMFSYFDAGTVAYTNVAAYVIGALLIALLGGTIAAMIVKKTFSLKRMLLAAAAQLLVVLSTLVAMFAAYFLVTLMLTGFGVLPIHAITTISYFNAGLLIAAMLVSLASAFGFTILYKKAFKITSSDAVRGTTVLFAAAGIIMSFACPAYSFMTVWLGMLMTAVLLASVCLHKLFKNKFGFGMDRLYLYAIPVALCLPLIMAQIPMLMQLLPLSLLPVVMTVFTAMLGVAVPYLERTQPLFDGVAKKLPMRTQRVERTVTERVEDKAKKGKFTEHTVKRVEKEKVPVNYKNYFGISVVAVIAIVVALFSGGFGVTSDKTLAGYHTFDNAVYNDALVYEINIDSAGTEKQVVIDDLMLYKYARYAIDELEWDGVRYSKTVTNNIRYNEPTIAKIGNVYTVSPYEGSQAIVTLTIPSARLITKITVKETSKSGIDDYEGYVYEFFNQDEITLRMPYAFGSFTLEFEGINPSNIKYEEHVTVGFNETGTILDQLDDWVKLKRYYGDTDVSKSLRGAVVIKREFTSLS